MKKFRSLVLVLVLAFVLGACNMNQSSGVFYTNPIGDMVDIGDPFVLKDDDGKYYMYATSIPAYGFHVWESDNLVDWSEPKVAFDSLQQPEPWASRDFWAPEVFKHNDTYYMTYSARNRQDSLRIAIATSSSPTGPFIDQNTDVINEEGSYIDGHIFMDDDGQAYLYYSKDNYENIIDGNNVSQIYGQRLSDDLLSVEGDPVLLTTPEQYWEDPNGDFQWNEGAFVLKHEGLYYLMYSSGFFGNSSYSVGYGTSEEPLGEFTKYENNPILRSDVANGISGPGHNSVTVGLDDETMYIVYHIHTYPDNPSGDRRPAMDVLYFDDDGILTVDGPTYTEQEVK